MGVVVSIEGLKGEHIGDIKRISDETFGKGYLTEDIIRTFIDSPSHPGYVGLVEERVAGFCLTHYCTYGEFYDDLLLPEENLENLFPHETRISHRHYTAVDEAFSGQGVGKQLINYGLDMAHGKADQVISTAWKGGHGPYIGKLLQRVGYKKLKVISDYWLADSLRREYDCEACGSPPCHCTAIIYGLRL